MGALPLDDTIAAIATPVGEGGLGVVRLSGPLALEIADRVFESPRPLSDAPSHTLHHGRLRRGADLLDDAVAGVFRAPRSYTGEDVVEFSCHGGGLLLRRVLEACLSGGARLAGPGEFTRRAYVNGKMDLAQAEAVADLIAARSDAARRAGMAQLRGALSHRLNALRKDAIRLLARLEASLDFVDDEVPALEDGDYLKDLQYLRDGVDALRATFREGRRRREGLRVALTGRPNAGKSSLFNALLEEDRAIVAARPGTTRDTLEESVLIRDVPVVLTDTAGLRPSGGTVEREGAARARRALSAADLRLGVVDAARTPGTADRLAARAWRRGRTLLVLSKADRVSKRLRAAREHRWTAALGWGDRPRVWVSARSGEGLSALRDAVLASAGLAERSTERGEDNVWINARHDAALREARNALDAARAEAPPEARALELRRALGSLDELTGRGGVDMSEEVLDAVFSRFCIGK